MCEHYRPHARALSSLVSSLVGLRMRVEPRDHDLNLVLADMGHLLNRIEDAVPFISLAIAASGVNLSSTLPASISPSRLLQASTLLSAGDAAFRAGQGEQSQGGVAHYRGFPA